METFLLFLFGVVGMTHIIVDGAIMAPVRDWVKANLPEKVSDLFECYMCCGTWCGFLCGWILFSNSLPVIFVSGMAGSFLANFAAVVLNWMESFTVKNLGDE